MESTADQAYVEALAFAVAQHGAVRHARKGTTFADRLGLSGAAPDALTTPTQLAEITLRLAWAKQR